MATFDCPHCGTTYPAKPVLIGRAVRCTSCKQAFRLRPDGIADKIDSVESAPAPAPPAPVTPVPAALPPRVPPPAAASRAPSEPPRNGANLLPPTPPRGPDESSRSNPAASVRVRTDRLNKQQEEARRSLAASLSTAASQALKAESLKTDGPASQKPKRKTDRLARPGGEGAVGTIGPAITTGEGRRDFINNLVWFGGLLGVIGLIVAVVMVSSIRSPERQAVEDYAALVVGERNRPGERIAAIQERAWLAGVAPLAEAGSVTIRRTVTHPLAGARTVFAETLKGLVYLGNPAIWAPPEGADDLRRRWNAKQDVAANLQRLGKTANAVAHADVVAKLKEAGLGDDGVALLLALMHGTSNITPPISGRIAAGDLPDSIEIAEFTGRDGSLLVDQGRSYRTRAVNYSGRLLRFVGAGWPTEWRVLDIQTSGK